MLTLRHFLRVPCTQHCQIVFLGSSEHTLCEQIVHRRSALMHLQSQDRDNTLLMMLTDNEDKYDKPMFRLEHTALRSNPTTYQTYSALSENCTDSQSQC